MKKNIKPLVSVIVNCHNGEKFLNESLNSIISQTYKNWEIIFFDNLSTDKSSLIVKSLKDQRIKYFKTKKFLNLYHARNQAITKCKGKYICFLDTDDIWCRDKLMKQVLYLEKNKEFRLVYSNYFTLNHQNKKKEKKFNFIIKSGFMTQNLINNYTVGILTTIIEKKIFKYFKFKNNLNVIGDFDFFIRASQKFKFGYIKKPLAIYRIHESNLSKKKLNIYIKELSDWIALEKRKKSLYNFDKIKFYLLKLKIKYLFSLFGRVVQW